MTRTIKLNPIEQIADLFTIEEHEDKKVVVSHIKYDETLDDNNSKQITLKGSHDGTLFFTYKIIGEALEPLVNKRLYFREDISEEDLKQLKDIEYTIGDIEVKSEFGEVNLPAGKFHGQTDTVTIPVQCKYVF
ncbi:hypothetical protein [Bacillus smithii]|uniref:hypothetical protein n=1 Tax=Bacillus smithii TaxID=1479 RepID=UPI003D25D396